MKLRMALVVASLAGLFVSAYLWLYKLGVIGSLVCGTGGCETVQLSRYSRFLGVDVAFIGLLGYLLLFGLGTLSLQPRWQAARWLAGLLTLASGAGLAFALYLQVVELVVIRAICRWCVASALLIAACFGLSLLAYRRAGSSRA